MGRKKNFEGFIVHGDVVSHRFRHLSVGTGHLMVWKRCHELLEAKLVLGKGRREVTPLGVIIDWAAVGLAAVVGHLGINVVVGKRRQRRVVSHGSLGSRALNSPSHRSPFQFFFAGSTAT